MRRIIFITLLAMLAFTSQAQYNRVNDIVYTAKTDPYSLERCKLDVYYPTSVKDAPVVVWFHGGGLEGGGKHIDAELQNSGLVVIAANYRFLTKVDADECIDDAAEAVAWAFKHAAEYNGDPSKIFVAGHSAGGYLTCMIGMDKSRLAKYGIDADSIAALVPFSGQAVTHFNVRKKQGIGPLQPTIDKYAPIYYLRKDMPPTVIISGDREQEIFGRYEEQAYLWRMLKLVGNTDVTIYEIQGHGHTEMMKPGYHILKDTIKRLTKKK